MKIHMTKNQTTERAGLFRKVQVWHVRCWIELSAEEQDVLDANPDVASMVFVEYAYKGAECNATVGSITNRKNADTGGWTYVMYNSSDMIEFENTIRGQAQALKDHLMSLADAQGTTVTEI